MSLESRQHYESLARDDRERYLHEIQALPPDARFREPKLKKRRRIKEKGAPKRVLTSYAMFVKEVSGDRRLTTGGLVKA